VVNINTESSIKNPHHRAPCIRSRQEEGARKTTSSRISLINSSAAGRQEAPKPALSAALAWFRVIVDAKGYIVTNRHVVEKDRIRVNYRMKNPASPGHDAN